MEPEIRRKPGRPPNVEREATMDREEVVGEARRRRKNAQAGQYNLHVPPEMYEPGGVLDRTKWESRWINDEKNRIEKLTVEDDWDIVSKAGVSRVDDGEAMRYPIGRHDDGRTRYAFLCRKSKKFADEDRAEKAAKVAEIQQQALKGRPLNAPAVEEGYIPKSA